MQEPQYAANQGHYVQQAPYTQPSFAAPPAQYAPQPGPPPHQTGAPIPYNTGEAVPPPRKHALLELLPMFPLESAESERQRQEALAHSAWFKSRIQTVPQKTAMDRVGLAFIGATTGATLVNHNKIDNAGMKLASATNELLAAQIQQLILTRWTLADGGEPLLVDVIEHRSMGFNSYYVKASRDAHLKFRDKHTAKMKGNKSWSKKWNTTPVDVVAVVGKGGGEVALEQVLRLSRPVSAAEAVPLIKSFEKQWGVPSPV